MGIVERDSEQHSCRLILVPGESGDVKAADGCNVCAQDGTSAYPPPSLLQPPAAGFTASDCELVCEKEYACERACVRACVRACGRACVRA